MDLLVFDLDGTLLNKQSKISPLTQKLLQQLKQHDIAYTVATGRTFSSAQEIISGHGFVLPHIYSNGVIIWHPQEERLTLDNCLTRDEATMVMETTITQNVTPFVSAVNHKNQHFIFHPPARNLAEKNLLHHFKQHPHMATLPIKEMPENIFITNVCMIGNGDEIDTIHNHINQHTHLIAYSGPAVEGDGLKWMDIHHSKANKGSAINILKEQLKTTRLICFGDSDNDLSMFAHADECYAMANAKSDVKAAATDIIGHHNEDGVAHFLKEKYQLTLA